ncbi:MAG: hypothetical protein JRG94_15870 [Deltaproteobacteria bacterium]|nr:hypothetical protein [Deltaproteobacteria bacterium]
MSRRSPLRRASRLSSCAAGRVVLRSVLLSSLIASTAVAAATDASFDYLYIESNEGGSSGGHTAIRFGRDVYHFQSENGLLVLRRDLADEFLYSYALLGNRTIHSTRVAVSKEAFSSLVNRFRRRHRSQEAQIGVGDALRRDQMLLELLRDHEKDPAHPLESLKLPVPGLGYFERLDSAEEIAQGAHQSRSAALLSLRDVIVRAKGPNFVSNRRRALMNEMRVLSVVDPTDWTVEPPTSVYEHPPFARSYSSRWLDLAAGLAALEILDEGRPLAPATHRAPTEAYFALAPQEIRALQRYAAQLAGQLVELLDSRRADWGQTLLIGMARLSALTRSVETGHLVFLDTFPDTSRTLDGTEINRSREIGSMMLLENQRQLDASRVYFRESAGAGELAWGRVEERSNRYFEILRALRDEAPMRVARGHLVPSHEAPYPVPFSPGRSDARRSEDLAQARHRERAYSRELNRLHRYGLIDQNCATALFETINDSFGGSVQISRQQLGGHVRSRRSLAFIPFVSSRQVGERYTLVARETIPSYRQLRLQAMRDHESTVRVAFRESNTFTSTTYQRSSADSFFVFFTDETPLLRPLFGVVNLTAALGQSLLGVVTAPVDGGHNLIRGLRGAFVSLPELAFANIRKGSNDWIPYEHRSLEPVALAIDHGS